MKSSKALIQSCKNIKALSSISFKILGTLSQFGNRHIPKQPIKRRDCLILVKQSPIGCVQEQVGSGYLEEPGGAASGGIAPGGIAPGGVASGGVASGEVVPPSEGGVIGGVIGGVVGGGVIPPGDSVPSGPGGTSGEVVGGGVEPSGGIPSLGGAVVGSGAGLLESLGADGSDSEGVEGSVVLSVSLDPSGGASVWLAPVQRELRGKFLQRIFMICGESSFSSAFSPSFVSA